MISRDLFEKQVKDALSRFYDSVYLQAHPLRDELVAAQSPRESSALVLRRLLTDAVESLRPDPSISFHRREWLYYRVLRQHYLLSQDLDVVCRELGIGQTTFYEYRRQALEAVAAWLWDKYRGQIGVDHAEQAVSQPPDAGERAAQEAIRLARSSDRQWVDLGSLLGEIQEIVLPLTQQEGIAVRVTVPTSLPRVYGTPAMLKQIFVSMLSEGVRLAAGDSLEFTAQLEAKEIVWRLAGLDRVRLSHTDLDQVPSLVVSRGVLSVYGGRIWLESSETACAVCLSLSAALPATLLVIDDDSATFDLYQRYCRDRDYVLLTALNNEELERHLSETRPDLILLDVLMPHDDGWSILRSLKSRPATAGIPIVICSVLSQPHLATALGAAAVLQKPIDQETLLQMVTSVLGQ